MSGTLEKTKKPKARRPEIDLEPIAWTVEETAIAFKVGVNEVTRQLRLGMPHRRFGPNEGSIRIPIRAATDWFDETAIAYAEEVRQRCY